MDPSSLLLTVIAALGPAGLPAQAGGELVEFHVAPDGRDSWSGRLAEPSEDGSDGPFATPGRALRAVREARAAGARPVGVVLADGIYELAEPLVFTHQEGGRDLELCWKAAEDARPILSGGRRITGWEVGEDGRWRVVLPEVREGTWDFTQLWVNDQRRFRPRLPREGWYTVEAALEPSEAAAGQGHDRFVYSAGDIDPTWDDLATIEVMALHIWSASRMRIGAIDPESHAVSFTGPTRTLQRWGAFLPGYRYRLENVRAALGEPGDWYLDHERGELIYVPLPGETPESTVVVAPRLDEVVRLEGDVAGRRFVENLRFQGLTFAHAGWTCPPQGQSFPQAEVHLGGAIEAVGARGVTFEGCAIRHVGRYALAFGAGCRKVTVGSCELVDLGAGGVKIGTGGGAASWTIGVVDPADPESAVQGVTLRGTRIAHGGRLHPAAVGVWIGHASHCHVLHCDIGDLYYSGVSVGWTWGYAEPSRAHHNEVAYNRIHDIGQGLLSDMAGVYTLGVSPGTRVHHNLIRDVEAHDYGGWGLYTDEGSTGIEMTHNVVWRTKTGGFHQHYGRDNRIAHNILADSRLHQVQRTRAEPHRSFTFEHNIVYWTNDSPLLASNWEGDGFALDRNVYWNPAHPVRFPGGLDLEAWREQRGQDLHSLVADPLFVDPAADDWRLREGSPALELGFEAWDPAKAGPRGPALRAADLPPVPSDW